ncbi:MAG: hypothetical protein WBF43_02665 [Methylocella sp.]
MAGCDVPRQRPKSQVQSFTYLVIAAYYIIQAFTCGGWVCDLIELPMTIRFGLIYSSLLQRLDPNALFGSITYDPVKPHDRERRSANRAIPNASVDIPKERQFIFGCVRQTFPPVQPDFQ